ncbi:SPFH domain-containing protein [Trinickia fusca]|uniref:Protease modulator HflK n=1 Tax=Trinickia fusca TaxID=2419777 RepID=A0A494X1I4_9BURK|nr:SPFH domain-containing protein [Trinickia fusca]RKP44180.1 protease modulator HflK [Trinickia fusca]
MTRRDMTASLGPTAQAVRLSFWFVAAIAALAACAWAFSNVRRIPAESRAVVMRFGAFVRTQDAGLLIAWPRPFETVQLVPGSASVLALPIQSLQRDVRARAADPAPASEKVLPDALAGSGYVLTGDNGVVQLSATLYYRVVDPYAYMLQRDRLDAALERIVSASAVDVAAKRELDAILVARPEQLASDQTMALKREQLRDDLASEVERHLTALEAGHAGLGVEVVRVDLQTAFPAAAMNAFNSVLTSLQDAQRGIADARTFAERRRQEAAQDADRILEDARASAAERLAAAQASTADIRQFVQTQQGHDDPGLVARLYRDRMQQILSKARVTTIDPRDTSSLILPGNAK